MWSKREQASNEIIETKKSHFEETPHPPTVDFWINIDRPIVYDPTGVKRVCDTVRA